MALRGEGLVDGAASSAASAGVYVIHPNCSVEEF